MYIYRCVCVCVCVCVTDTVCVRVSLCVCVAIQVHSCKQFIHGSGMAKFDDFSIYKSALTVHQYPPALRQTHARTRTLTCTGPSARLTTVFVQSGCRTREALLNFLSTKTTLQPSNRIHTRTHRHTPTHTHTHWLNKHVRARYTFYT